MKLLTAAAARSTRPRPIRRWLVAAVVAAILFVPSVPGAFAQVPELNEGVPLLPIPEFEEVGLPAFTMPEGSSSLMPPEAPAVSGAGGGSYAGGPVTAVGSSQPLDTMRAQSWGYAAERNMVAMGVNPSGGAGTCVLESNCTNVQAREGSNIRGAFQMLDSTYTAAIRAAATENPGLAGTINTSLAGSMDPANQAIAAAQELKIIGRKLQANGFTNPTVLDTRAGFNFGSAYTVPVAQAADSQPLGTILRWDASTYASNGLTPSTTVGEWRARVAGKLGNAANQPVFLPSSGATVSAGL